MRPKPTSLRYLPQLDGLRGYAVFLVLVEHYVPGLLGGIAGGRLGVRLFFVLSGYLITRTLMESRAEFIGRTGERSSALAQFYVRRVLRLMPAYYLTIVVMSWADAGVARTAPWHLFYLSNIGLAVDPGHAASVAHFWSLSVEEQFYLVWPVAMLLCPGRYLVAAIVAAILAAPAYRAHALASGWGHVITQWQLPSCLDTLGAGALLALVAGRVNARVLRKLLRVLFALGLPLVVFCYSQPRDGAVLTVWGDTACALLFGALVVQSATFGLGRLMPLVTNRAAVRIGQISYGIYLFHLPVRYIWQNQVARWLGLPAAADTNSVLTAAALTVGTITIAAISWQFIEAPVLALKSRWTSHGPVRPGRGDLVHTPP